MRLVLSYILCFLSLLGECVNLSRKMGFVSASQNGAPSEAFTRFQQQISYMPASMMSYKQEMAMQEYDMLEQSCSSSNQNNPCSRKLNVAAWLRENWGTGVPSNAFSQTVRQTMQENYDDASNLTGGDSSGYNWLATTTNSFLSTHTAKLGYMTNKFRQFGRECSTCESSAQTDFAEWLCANGEENMKIETCDWLCTNASGDVKSQGCAYTP